jgi:hypothetical protein
MKLLDIISVGIRRSISSTDHISFIRQMLQKVAYQVLITFLSFVKCCKKWEYNETVYQLFMDFNNAYDSAWKEVLYNMGYP